MDNIAWHDNPVHASDFFIRMDLSAHEMPGRFEQLWVKGEENGQFRVCCLPFFAYGIALGDTVETDEEFTFRRVVSKSGHKLLRIAVPDDRESRLHPVLHDWVENSELLYEFYSPGYLSVDLPPGYDDFEKMSPLDELQRSGEIYLEIVE